MTWLSLGATPVLAPPSSSTSPLLYAIAVLLSGGLLTALGALYRERRRGPGEMERERSITITESVKAAREMLEEYRRDLAAARRELKNLSDDLGKANERISHLEGALSSSQSTRDHLMSELNFALERRAVLERQVAEQAERIAHLETLFSREMVRGGRRKMDPGPQPGNPKDPDST